MQILRHILFHCNIDLCDFKKQLNYPNDHWVTYYFITMNMSSVVYFEPFTIQLPQILTKATYSICIKPQQNLIHNNLSGLSSVL